MEEDREHLGWVSGQRVPNRNEKCAICHTVGVSWVHYLDPNKLQFKKYGKGHQLRGLWTLCDRCEDLYSSGGVDAVVSLKATAEAGMFDDLEEEIVGQLNTFAAADRGATPIDSPRPVS